MKLSRRLFLGSSAVVLSSQLLDSLATPLWKWRNRVVLAASAKPVAAAAPAVTFVDVAKEACLTVTNVWGGVEHKDYIMEAKGSGLAFFDYDMDGWLDVYLTNGSRLNTTWPAGQEPTSHLFKNNRDGTFTDVTAKSGLGIYGWQTAICVGDYDNDG